MTLPPISTHRTETADIASVYERSIPAQHRLRNGQYYTPFPLCDLILSLACHPVENRMPERLLEPGCGAGQFLVRADDRFRQFGRSEVERWGQLQGVELDAQAAQLAMARLGEQRTNSVLVADFISPQADELGLFDVVVGNPPYVRQEHVAQSLQMDKQAAHAYLQAKYADYLAAYPQQKALFSQTADLYLWFYLQAATLLKPGGKLAFVTSNSWLNAAYGQAFRLFLNHHFRVLYLVESACERWFREAAINPLVLVLQKKEGFCGSQETSGENSDTACPVRLIRLYKPLVEWMPNPQSETYWQTLDTQVKALPQDADAVCNTIPQTALSGAISTDSNWAFLLRAPAELVRLAYHPDLWLGLEALGRVRYPLKTGINRFFYLSHAQAKAWGIEPEYLFPVIRSARKVKTYCVDADTCDELLFSCPDSLEELARKGKTGALNYIRWGATQTSQPRQKRSQPIPWPQVPSVQSNRPWYFVKPLAPAHILCSRFIDQRFFFPLCQGNLMEDQTFYGLTLTESTGLNALPPMLAAALLNSTLSYLRVEYNARTNLGEGVLQYARCDMAAFPIINPALYRPAEQAAILDAFGRMMERSILPIADEVNLPDRVELDLLVLRPLLAYLNWDEDAQTVRNRLAAYLTDRVRERVLLARSARR